MHVIVHIKCIGINSTFNKTIKLALHTCIVVKPWLLYTCTIYMIIWLWLKSGGHQQLKMYGASVLVFWCLSDFAIGY